MTERLESMKAAGPGAGIQREGEEPFGELASRRGRPSGSAAGGRWSRLNPRPHHCSHRGREERQRPSCRLHTQDKVMGTPQPSHPPTNIHRLFSAALLEDGTQTLLCPIDKGLSRSVCRHRPVGRGSGSCPEEVLAARRPCCLEQTEWDVIPSV